VALTYSQVKALLLATSNACSGTAAVATTTGGRLDVGRAMQALSLMLRQRSGKPLPAMALSAAEDQQLRQDLLMNAWGRQLLGNGTESLVKGGGSSRTTTATKLAADANASSPVSKANAAHPPVSKANATYPLSNLNNATYPVNT
jgi:hypothetical protein